MLAENKGVALTYICNRRQTVRFFILANTISRAKRDVIDQLRIEYLPLPQRIKKFYFPLFVDLRFLRLSLSNPR